MLKRFTLVGTVLFLSLTSLLAVAANQGSGEITFCPPIAQCPDKNPNDCYAGNGWQFDGSSHEQVTPSPNYAFSYAVYDSYSVIDPAGAECSYFLNNDPLNMISFNRTDLKNVAPLPGNLWRSEGNLGYTCQKSAAPFVTTPSECPFTPSKPG